MKLKRIKFVWVAILALLWGNLVLADQLSGRVYDEAGTRQPLSSGATFTGPWIDMQAYNSVVVAVDSDQEFSYQMQFSDDASTLRSSISRSFKPTKLSPAERFTIGRQYVRVTATNDSGVDMTDLSIQVLAGDKTGMNFPVDTVLPHRADANAVRIDDYKIDIAMGRREGIENWRKWGYNDDIDTGAEETVWAAGGVLVPLSTPRTLELTSSSIEDGAAGTGLRQAQIVGVGASRVYQTETIGLNGTGTVTTVLTWLGVNRVLPVEVGSTGNNVGNITVTSTTDATTQAYIPAGTGVTQQALFFVPANRIFLVDGLLINVLKISQGNAPRVTLFAYYHDTGVGSVQQVFRHDIDTEVENTSALISLSNPFHISEGDILEFRAVTSADDTTVNINFWATELQSS